MIFSMIILAISWSPRLAPRCTRQSFESLIRQVRMVWSIVQDFLPCFTVSSSSNSILDEQILNFFIASLKFSSLLEVPVTPIMLGSKQDMNFLIFSMESLSGSTETNTVLRLIYWYSGIFLIFSTARLSLISELGQMSGQLVNPKQIKQQVPYKSSLPKGLPLTSISFQGPPICTLPVEDTLAMPVMDLSIFFWALMVCTSIMTQTATSPRAVMPIRYFIVLFSLLVQLTASMSLSTSAANFYSVILLNFYSIAFFLEPSFSISENAYLGLNRKFPKLFLRQT